MMAAALPEDTRWQTTSLSRIPDRSCLGNLTRSFPQPGHWMALDDYSLSLGKRLKLKGFVHIQLRANRPQKPLILGQLVPASDLTIQPESADTGSPVSTHLDGGQHALARPKTKVVGRVRPL